jgi:hypothetical protein
MPRTLGELGLAGTIPGLVFVHTVCGLAYTTLFFRNFLIGVLDGIVQAAQIEGAGFFGIAFTVGETNPVTVALNNVVNTSTGVKEYNVDMAAAIIAALPTLATVHEDCVDLFVAAFMGSPPITMLRGRLVRDNGMAVLCGEGATQLRFPLPDRIARRLAGSEWRDVVLGLRPETIFAAGTELPGPDSMIVFEIGGQDFIARLRPQDARLRGSVYRFEVEMDRARLFDAKSGLRL